MTNAPSLRSLSLSELLDQAIRLYRQNFIKFVGIVAVIEVPLMLVQLIVTLLTINPNPETLTGGIQQEPFKVAYLLNAGGTFLVVILTFILIQGVATAALTRAIADSRLGEATDIVEAYSKIGSTWLSLIGALILVGLLSFALLIWSIIPCLGTFTGPGALIFLFASIVPLIAPIVVLERKGALESLRRAWDLARRRFWWVVGFVFILYLFNQLIVTGPSMLTGSLIAYVLGNSIDSSTQLLIRTIVQSLTQLIFSLIYLPLQLTSITLMYFDLRVRTEGLDLSLQTNSSTDQTGSMVAMLSQSPSTSTDTLITSLEAGYFVILSLAIGILYFLIFGLFTILMALAMSTLGSSQGLF